MRDPDRRRGDGNPAVTTGTINGNAPLVLDETMLGVLRAFVRRNQPVLGSPFVLGGANTRGSVAPAVAQITAVALRAYKARRERKIPAEDALNQAFLPEKKSRDATADLSRSSAPPTGTR